MNQTDHLALAKEYIGKGEDYYRKAAEEIVAAMDADPTLSFGDVGAELDRDKSWVHKIVQWSTSVVDDNAPTPFSEAAGKPNRDESGARKMIREKPEFVAEAITRAPAETQRKIAAAIIRSADTDQSLRDVVDPKPRKPKEKKPAWQRLSNYTFGLWEVGQDLMDEAPTDEERVRMISSAEKAQRLATGIAMLLNTGELDDAFRELLSEINPDEIKADV